MLQVLLMLMRPEFVVAYCRLLLKASSLLAPIGLYFVLLLVLISPHYRSAASIPSRHPTQGCEAGGTGVPPVLATWKTVRTLPENAIHLAATPTDPGPGKAHADKA